MIASGKSPSISSHPMEPTEADSYRNLLRIRRFEEHVLELFPRGVFYGTTHTYIGQEANAVGVLHWREENDVVVSNHRCHGHFLAYGGSMQALAAELMGRSTGVCGGRGGSQHLQWNNFYANGILGGTIPLAVGMAVAVKTQSAGTIVFAFMGDGTLGEGVVYESFNMASLWGLPVFFVLENNRYAQSTPVTLNLAGDIAKRFEAFGIPTSVLDTTDVGEIREVSHEIVARVRNGGGPCALVIDTYRFAPHSKGDDVRDPQEIDRYKQRDPMILLGEKLNQTEKVEIEMEVDREVQEAFEAALSAPVAEATEITEALGHD
jgi:TPP-dependent pyruvate/acetoin dehydrogenase alpha subunit